MGKNNITYTFSAQDAASEKWIDLEIVESCDLADRYFRTVWHKLALAAANAYRFPDGDAAPNWTGWEPHDWNKKVVPDRLKFVAWDGPVLAGFLNIRTGQRCCLKNQPMIYVEHLATFPGNLETNIWHRRLSHVGPALLAFAILEADKRKIARLGLHADDDAVGWYDKLHKQRSLFDVRQRDVPGPYSNSLRQWYFECSIDQARTLLDDYKDV